MLTLKYSHNTLLIMKQNIYELGKHQAATIINAPIESINLGDWMFTITSEEYEACSKDHQSACQSTMPDGKALSINVETIAGNQVVQHYIEEERTRNRAVGFSPNTVVFSELAPDGFLLIQVKGEIEVEKIDSNKCNLTCTVTNTTLVESIAQSIKEMVGNDDITLPHPVQEHVEEEVVRVGKNIEEKALLEIWK